MPPTRRTLLQASALGFAASVAGYTETSEVRHETERTAAAKQEETEFTVAVRTDPELGVILTDGGGMTLYRFTQDEEGQSTCYDDCAEAWPPLTADELNIPEGLPGEFDTTERDDGGMQVTYNGMPLYYFQNDEEAGDTNGQGVNDVWFVVNPACPEGDMTTPVTPTEDDEDGDGDGGDGDGGGDGGDGDGDGGGNGGGGDGDGDGDGGGDGGGGVYSRDY